MFVEYMYIQCLIYIQYIMNWILYAHTSLLKDYNSNLFLIMFSVWKIPNLTCLHSSIYIHLIIIIYEKKEKEKNVIWNS